MRRIICRIFARYHHRRAVRMRREAHRSTSGRLTVWCLREAAMSARRAEKYFDQIKGA